MSVRDIYYILFRHKWMIILLTVAGVVAAYGVLKMWPFPYNSEAKVLIHFIADATAPAPAGDGKVSTSAQVTTPDERGVNVLNTQLEFLTSGDLALQVATNLGPEKILGKSASSNSITAAAAAIRSGLVPDVPKNSDTITLTYSSTDPQMVQQILAKLLDAYQQKFTAVYRTPGYTDEDMLYQTGLARERLTETAQVLEVEKVKFDITSLPEAMKAMAENLNRTESAVFETRTELAESDANIKDMQERLSVTVTNVSATNHATNVMAIAQPAAPSADILAKYQSLNSILNNLRIREQTLLSQFTTNTKIVQNAMQQRKQAEDNVAKFEAENPSVTAIKTNFASGPTMVAAAAAKEDPYTMLYEEQRKRDALAAKFKELTNQLAIVRTNAANLDVAESRIRTMESEYDVAENKYKFLLMATAQSHMNDALASKVSGISVIEEPTAPYRDAKTVLKATAGTFALFLFLAFGLPFFIEMVLDQSLKNPVDVQSRINAPFFLTIPKTNGKFAALNRAQNVPLLANGSDAPASGGGDKSDLPPSNGRVAAWDKRHALQPFFEALRDRLMTFFEMNDLTHKPKLVAVTSCGPGAGVTTTAAGLASSLSETGEGNVLLVNMNVRDGEAHHFYKGKMDCGIEDALENTKRDQAQVHDNLYVALETSSADSLPRVMPKRFSHLLPLMKASDYDYIIFDMPPVSEISITPRLSRFMDLVLLVIESEKTSRETATRVASRLAESKTNVGLVLNKNRSYVPKVLDDAI
jgi:Mrp family chromosome partitioning ATPase/uncharacterized protein involved in exopolysaccharide biosynthesis